MSVEEITRAAAPSRVTGLEQWDWHGQPAVPEPLLRAMLDHPAFAAAHRAAIDGALAFADTDPGFQQMMLDMGGFFLCFLTLYMDATTGITHRALREIAGGGVVLSAGRATAILWRLRGGKYIEPGRENGFVPTRRLRGCMRQRWHAEHVALQFVDPAVAAASDRLEDDRFFAALIRHLGADLGMGSSDRPDDTGLTNMGHLSGRAAGMLITFALIEAARENAGSGTFPPTGLTAPSISVIARRFGVSRRHVLRVLKEMQAMGFLACENEQWILLPELGQALRLFHALLFVRQLRAAHRALGEDWKQACARA